MKALVCEMCNGTDIVKRDGFFVCQHCGMKCSADEAKKMMMEGTVRIDTSGELENLYQVARRAKKDSNTELAKKYYDMILAKDPQSWEAAFYTVYYWSMSCKIGQIGNAAADVLLCENTVLQLIQEKVTEPKERETAIIEIGTKLIVIANMLFNAAKEHYDGIGNSIRHEYTQEFIDRAVITRNILATYGDSLIKLFGDDYGKVAANVWKVQIDIYEKTIPYLANRESHKTCIEEIKKKIGKYDKDYIIAELEKEIDILEMQANFNPFSGANIGLIAFFGVAFVTGLYLIQNSAWWGILAVVSALMVLGGIGSGITERRDKKRAIKLLPQKKAELEKFKK